MQNQHVNNNFHFLIDGFYKNTFLKQFNQDQIKTFDSTEVPQFDYKLMKKELKELGIPLSSIYMIVIGITESGIIKKFDPQSETETCIGCCYIKKANLKEILKAQKLDAKSYAIAKLLTIAAITHANYRAKQWSAA